MIKQARCPAPFCLRQSFAATEGALLMRKPLDFRRIKGFLTNTAKHNSDKNQQFKAFVHQ